MPRKRTKNLYFTQETEDKIFEYIEETNENRRNYIYSKYLYEPFKTISEVYHSKLSTDYIEESREDAINDCVAYLTTQAMYGIRKGKGKAFSYLSISARNFFIQLNNKEYRKLKKFNTDGVADDLKDYMIDDSIPNKEYNKEFLEKYYGFLEWFKSHLPTMNMYEPRRVQVWKIVEYMEVFETPSFFKKDVLQEIYSLYGFRNDNYAIAREVIKLNMQHYFREWEKENYNPEPLSLRRKQKPYTTIPEVQQDYIRKHYQKCSHQYGVRALSKRLNLPEHSVREFAIKEGLH